MYNDDLDDLFPKPSAAPAGFEDPFQNPFNSDAPTSSLDDPWSSPFGQASTTGRSTGGFDDWNTNAFADEPSSNPNVPPISPTQERSQAHGHDSYTSQAQDATNTTEYANNTQSGPISSHEPPTAHAEISTADKQPPEKSEVVDPLDAALSNIEDPPEHVPVFKRKLPLVMDNRSGSVAEPSPVKEAQVAQEIKDVKDVPEDAVKKDEKDSPAEATPVLATAETTPTKPSKAEQEQATNASDVVATTPTLSNPQPDTEAEPEPISLGTTDAAEQQHRTPPATPPPFELSRSSPTDASSREPSGSDIDTKSANKITVSPLEHTPVMMPNPLDRSYTAPVSGVGFGDTGGWGDTWNPGAGMGFNSARASSFNSFPASGGGLDSQMSPSAATPANTPFLSTSMAADEVKEEEEDSDDNVPLAQSLKPPAAVSMYQITVGDPQKVGDPISAHIIYTVHTRTSNPDYKKPEFSVLRRYSDFVWLYDTLCQNNPGVIVPPIPEKNSLNRFQDAFVEARRLALNKCIQKIANHPGLCNDKDLKLFLESDNFSLDIKHRRAEEGTGILSILSTSISSSKFYETDEWFDNKKAYLDGLENQLRGLVKAMEIVGRQRAEMSLALGEFSDTMEALSTTDISQQLSATFENLAKLHRKAKELQDDQSQEDIVTFAGTVEEYGRLIGSVRLAFASRVKCYGQWQNAESDLRRVKTNHEKAKKQSKTPERLHYHMQEVADAERKASHTKSEFERVTKLIKIELHRFDMERVEDFKRSLEAFLEGMIRRQKELIQTWEEYQALLLNKSIQNPGETPGDEQSDGHTVSSAA